MRKRQPQPWPESPACGVIQEKRKRAEKRVRRIWRGLWIVAALLLAGALCTQVLSFAMMQGEDMEPAIQNGDLLLISVLEKTPSQGDVVRFQEEETYRVGMIAAIGGDEVSLDEQGRLVVNGIPQTENLPFATYPINGGVTFPFTVSNECYFILCANRENATDSRVFGEISSQQIQGRVIRVIRRKGI